MKKMKKIMALAIAMVMVLSMSISVFAEGEKTITAPNNGHTYEIFQIFTGTVSEGKLVNLKYGTNAVGTLNADVTQADITKLNAITDAGTTVAQDQADIAAMAKFVNLNSSPVATIKDGQTYAAPVGYYLIRDKAGTVPTNEQYTLYLMSVVNEDITITPKTSTTTSEKKLDDVNDSDGTSQTLQDSADYDIGDAVPYHLKATIAENISAYKKYHLTFQDTLEAGSFSAISDLTIKVDGIDISTGTFTGFTVTKTVTTAPTVNGFDITLTFNPSGEGVTLLPASLAGKNVTIDFTATLGEGAKIGQEGNVNTFVLKYSNNPNSTDDSEEGTTPEDTVIVFTYELDVNKTDAAGEPLNGATFALYKKYATVPSGKTAATSPITYGNDKSYTIPSGTNYVLVGTISGTDKSLFEFKGIDDGEYLLVETVTPTGYNAIAPQTFSVTAEHTATADINKTTKKDANRSYVLTSVSGAKTGDSTITLSQHTKDSKITGVDTTIVNESGAVLPSTGGIGTTIFYIIGAILVIGAGVVLVTRRRMSAN